MEIEIITLLESSTIEDHVRLKAGLFSETSNADAGNSTGVAKLGEFLTSPEILCEVHPRSLLLYSWQGNQFSYEEMESIIMSLRYDNVASCRFMVRVDGYPSCLMFFTQDCEVQCLREDYFESVDNSHLTDFEENLNGFIEFLQSVKSI